MPTPEPLPERYISTRGASFGAVGASGVEGAWGACDNEALEVAIIGGTINKVDESATLAKEINFNLALMFFTILLL